MIPGVMAASGLESAHVIQAFCDKFHPAAVIAVDALAAAIVSRVGKTIQMTDTGISPGRGMGYPRARLNEEVCGCLVIRLGLPTLVNTAAIISETISALGEYDEKTVSSEFNDDIYEF